MHVPPAVKSLIDHAAQRADTGIIHENLQSAERLDCDGQHFPPAGLVGDVLDCRNGAAGKLRIYRVGLFADLGLIAVSDYDVRALNGQQPSGRGAKAACGARDQGCLIRNSGHTFRTFKGIVGGDSSRCGRQATGVPAMRRQIPSSSLAAAFVMLSRQRQSEGSIE